MLHTAFSMEMDSSTQLGYIHAWTGRYVFQWDRLLEDFNYCLIGSLLVVLWRDV